MQYVVWKLQRDMELERGRNQEWKSRKDKVQYMWKQRYSDKKKDRELYYSLSLFLSV